MKIETKTKDSYNRIEHNHIGAVGNQVIEINDIISWLEDRGHKAGVSRYSRYLDYIKDFQLKPDKDGEMKILLPSDLEELYKKADKAILEIMQLKWVYKAFKNIESRGFDDRLDKIVSGKDFYTGGSQDSARDFLYELVVAAWLANKGYVIDFDSPDNTDVVGKRDNTDIYIECKRLKSVNKYEENYRKGCKQLKKISGCDSAIKLVYVDIYNCISDQLKPYEYTDITDIEKTVRCAMRVGFISENQKLTDKIQTDQDVDGVVFTSISNFGVNSSLGIENAILDRK